MKHTLFIFLLAAFCFLPCMAWADQVNVTAATMPAPKISSKLKFDKPGYYLGENIYAQYGVTNLGDAPVKIFVGGYGDGEPREDAYKLVAFDAAGKAMPDPYSHMQGFGGVPMGKETIDPGKTCWHSVQLLEYCDITQPGRYTVRMYHHTGWGGEAADLTKSPITDPSVAEATLTLLMPTSAQAGQIISQVERMPADQQMPDFGLITPMANISALHFPVYRPMLSNAMNADWRFIEGIIAMPSVDATRVLLRLAGEGRKSAMQALNERLPHKDGVSIGGIRRDWPARTWDDTLNPSAKTLAWTLLAKPDAAYIACGAGIIQYLGDGDDLPRFLLLMNRDISAMQHNEQAMRPDESVFIAGQTLTTTGEILVSRGAALPSVPRDPASAILVMSAIGKRTNFRPAGWLQIVRWMLQHPIPLVRASALNYMPIPLDPELLVPVLALQNDCAPGVQEALCWLASRLKDPRFGEVALEVLRSTTDFAQIDMAHQAAVDCAVPKDRWLEVCINRLDEPRIEQSMLQQIYTIIDCQGFGVQDMDQTNPNKKLKHSWLAFLNSNRAAIRAGKIFSLGQPQLTPDLIPHGVFLTRADGSQWPASP